jgi:hypothetical protein
MPFSMKSTNSTPLQSRSTITITLLTDSPILNFFYHTDPGCFHSILARFVLAPVTACLRKLWPWMACYRRNESALNILCTLWSSESAHGSSHAQTLWKPTFSIILTVVQCERPKQCSSSLSHSSVIQDCSSTRALFSRACCCQPATSFIVRCANSTGFEVWTPFCHTLMILHLFPINLD